MSQTDRNLLENGKRFDQTTVMGYPGSSGGGVYLASSGECIGLLVRGAGPGLNFIVSVRRMLPWARRMGIEWALDPNCPMPSHVVRDATPLTDGSEFCAPILDLDALETSWMKSSAPVVITLSNDALADHRSPHMAMFKTRFESQKQEWETPLDLFERLDREFGFHARPGGRLDQREVRRLLHDRDERLHVAVAQRVLAQSALWLAASSPVGLGAQSLQRSAKARVHRGHADSGPHQHSLVAQLLHERRRDSVP